MVSSRVPPSLLKLEWALQSSRGYNHWASRKASTGLNWEEGSCVQGTVASCLQNGKSQLGTRTHAVDAQKNAQTEPSPKGFLRRDTFISMQEIQLEH